LSLVSRKSNIYFQKARLDLQRIEHEFNTALRKLSSLFGPEPVLGSLVGTLSGSDDQTTFDGALYRALNTARN